MGKVDKLERFAQQAYEILANSGKNNWGKHVQTIDALEASATGQARRIQIFKRKTGNIFRRKTITTQVFEGETTPFVQTVQQRGKNKMTFSIFADGKTIKTRVNRQSGELEAFATRATGDECEQVLKHIETSGNGILVHRVDAEGNALPTMSLRHCTFESGDHGVVRTIGDESEAIIIKADNSYTYRNTWHREADGTQTCRFDYEYGHRPYGGNSVPANPKPIVNEVPTVQSAETSATGLRIGAGIAVTGVVAPSVIVGLSELNFDEQQETPTESQDTIQHTEAPEQDTAEQQETHEEITAEEIRTAPATANAHEEKKVKEVKETNPQKPADEKPAKADSTGADSIQNIPQAENDSPRLEQTTDLYQNSIPILQDSAMWQSLYFGKDSAFKNFQTADTGDIVAPFLGDSTQLQPETTPELQVAQNSAQEGTYSLFNGEINEIQSDEHTIRQGETLWSIAAKYLREANPNTSIRKAQIIKQIHEFGRINPEIFGENPTSADLQKVFPKQIIKLRVNTVQQ